MIIASRQFTRPNAKKKKITMRIHKPVRIATNEWKCNYDIIGLDVAAIHDHVIGIDSLQGLVIAIESIRQVAARHKLLWLESEDTGLPILVPGFIVGLTDKVETIIRREAEKGLMHARKEEKRRRSGKKFRKGRDENA